MSAAFDDAVAAGFATMGQEEGWDPQPDLTVLNLNRREPPTLPLDVFGDEWGAWIATTADAAACPADYVATSLLAAASALIGHARWVQVTPGWKEPPHLWLANVGDSGTGKSGGADVLPEIERRMIGNFPERLEEWKAAREIDEAKIATWKRELATALKRGLPPPPRPQLSAPDAEPQQPRLRQSDVTIERVATLLATAAPKGLLVVRDKIAGWLEGLNAYNDSGRAFWIEAYGERPYRVERVMHPDPILIPRLAVSVHGSIQPERLSSLFRQADDGLLARFLWAWPDPLPFRLSREAPNVEFAIEALDQLRVLELRPGQVGTSASPIFIRLEEEALPALEEFGREMQRRQDEAGALLCSAYGKARGQAIRLALVLAFLRWAARRDFSPPPMTIPSQIFSMPPT